MTDLRPLDRMVTDWLRTEAPARAPERSLRAVLERVADTQQQPHTTQRLFGRALGGSRPLRLALAVTVVATLLLVAALVVGALRSVNPPPIDQTSGANGLVVFGRQGGPIGTTEATEIWVIGPGGEPFAAVPATAGIDRDCAALSPDGREVSFVETTGDLDVSLVIAALQKAGPFVERLRIAIGSATVGCPRWSPRAPQIAFVTMTGDLRLADLESRSTRVIRAPGGDAQIGAIAWAPDGSRIAVSTGRRIDLVPLDEGSPVGVTESRGNHGPDTGVEEFDGISWSLDGDMLAVWGENNFDDPGGSFMRIIQLDGSGEANLPVRGPVAEPIWSPVDERLAFLESRADIVIYRNSGVPGVAAQNVRLPRFDPAFSGSRAGISTFVWSQDGQWIVFGLFRATETDDESALAAMPADGSAAPELIVPWSADFFRPAGAQAGIP